jgi:hypothetical protein
MEARYRSDYPGEFVILESKWAEGRKEQRRDWIPNPIQNLHLSGRAACIGSNVDIDKFNYTLLQKHRGGLRSSKKLQTYGTASVALDMRLDFAVDINFDNLSPLLANQYVQNNTVYTTARNCIRYPGEFYLIPQYPNLCATALPIYLAAFDEHKEIFMLGYTVETAGDQSDWIGQIAGIISAYSGTLFTMVGIESNMPDEWMNCPNTRNFGYREFISYCDV